MANADIAAKAVAQCEALIEEMQHQHDALKALIHEAKERYEAPNKVNKLIKKDVERYFEAMAKETGTTVKEPAFVRMRNDLIDSAKNQRCFDIMDTFMQHKHYDDFTKLSHKGFHFILAINLCRFDDEYIISLTENITKIATTYIEYCDKAAAFCAEAIESFQPENNNISAQTMSDLKLQLNSLFELSEGIRKANAAIEPEFGQYYSVCSSKIKNYFIQIVRINMFLNVLRISLSTLVKA